MSAGTITMPPPMPDIPASTPAASPIATKRILVMGWSLYTHASIKRGHDGANAKRRCGRRLDSQCAFGRGVRDHRHLEADWRRAAHAPGGGDARLSYLDTHGGRRRGD